MSRLDKTSLPLSNPSSDPSCTPRILPDRCYLGIDEASIRYTEEHLRRTKKLRTIRFDDTVDRYIKRISDCRPSRRCNFSACPSCEVARQIRFCAQVAEEAAAHPDHAILCGDVLLESRDGLLSPGHDPKSDVRRFRKIVKEILPSARARDAGLYLLGRYEIAVKRQGSTAYLAHFEPGGKSRSVVPHFHFVMIAQEQGRYLTPNDIRPRLIPHFPEPRQIMVRRLMPNQPTQEALEARVKYVFKKRTAEFSGRVLRDFVHSQVWFRQDMWTLQYKRGQFEKSDAPTVLEPETQPVAM